MKKIIEDAYKKAIEVLESCSKPIGFYASGLKGGYEALWARDSMITTLGAMLVDDKFYKTIEKSIDLLAKHQSLLGQIPNCVGSYNLDRKSDVTFNSIDSSLWFIISTISYSDRTKNKAIYEKYKKNLVAAYSWLAHQDPDEVRLLAQQPTMDWMDAFPHKYGYCLNTQALYYGALMIIGKNRQARHLKKIVNGEIEKYISLYDEKLGHYYPWGWKNHDDKREHEEWFDALGNVLAIVTGLANNKIAKNILKHIEKDKINKPYACKAIFPPIKPGDKEWKDYFANCDARSPYQYLNGGIWPFIGGFYIAALIKMKEYKKAEEELETLAIGNMQKLNGHEFNEWLDGKTGEPKGEPYQAWTAATYIYGYECLKNKKVLHFDY